MSAHVPAPSGGNRADGKRVDGGWIGRRRFGAGWSRIPTGRSGGADGRRVLVLQGRLAIWTLWRDGRLVDERVERLDEAAAAATRCPWPAGAAASTAVSGKASGVAAGPAMPETFVDVVADSPLDEVERVLASGSDPARDPSPVDDPARSGARADASPPRRRSGRGTGGIGRWLLARRLARRHAEASVRLAPPGTEPLLAVLLSAELPEDWRRRLETLQEGTVTVRALHSATRLRAPSSDERRGDVLRVFRGGGAERHLLYRQGCPAFTRVVEPSDASAADGALAETRAYLAARHGVTDPREVHDPVAAGDAAIGGAGASAGVDDVFDARRLAALAVQVGRGAGTRSTSPLLEKRRRHVELRRLHVVTAATALVAGITVIASVVHGIDGARRRARAIAVEEALTERFDGLTGALDGRHPSSALADASLVRLDREDAGRGPDAIDVLGSLATVLTDHPGIALDRLAWSTGPADESLDEARVDTPSSLPVSRRSDADEVTPRVARLEIAGRIDPTGQASVRERQRRFEALVDAFEREATFTGLEVRLSPATAATEGQGTSRASGDDAGAADYELRVRREREERTR